jgi:hypothetical protein
METMLLGLQGRVRVRVYAYRCKPTHPLSFYLLTDLPTRTEAHTQKKNHLLVLHFANSPMSPLRLVMRSFRPKKGKQKTNEPNVA